VKKLLSKLYDVEVWIGGVHVPEISSVEIRENRQRGIIRDAVIMGEGRGEATIVSCSIDLHAESLQALVEALQPELYYLHAPRDIDVVDLVQTWRTAGTWPEPCPPIGPWYPRGFLRKGDVDAED